MERIDVLLRHYLDKIGASVNTESSEDLVEKTTDIPDWFLENNNKLYVATELQNLSVQLLCAPGASIPQNCVVVIRSRSIPQIQFIGSDAFIYIGRFVIAPGIFYCGNAAIIINDSFHCAYNLTLNARDTGVIYFEGDALVASNVNIWTDSGHKVLDAATRERIDVIGGIVIVKKHVWIGYEALIMGNATIGAHAMVAARAVVKNTYPDHCIIGGMPAKVLKTGITWEP